MKFDFDFDFEMDDDDDNDDDDNDDDDDDANNMNIFVDIIAYLFMILGWFIIIKSIADYLKAKRTEKIIRIDLSHSSSNNPNMMNMERIV